MPNPRSGASPSQRVGSAPLLGATEIHELDAAAFVDYAKTRLTTPDDLSRPSDFDLNPDLKADGQLGGQLRGQLRGPSFERRPPRAAAVLIPVIARQPLTVLFTVRANHLSTHAGQISFPGGRIDPGDGTAEAAALREAEEEIALARASVRPIGTLASYETATGYEITPLLALVPATFEPRANPNEVASVFEVPLSFLMNPANHKREADAWGGTERCFYAISYQRHYIWGATAGILHNMYGRLFAQ